MRIVAIILLVVACHLAYRGAVILGSAVQDGGDLSVGPEAVMYLLLAASLAIAASFIYKLQLFSTVPTRTAQMDEHNHVAPPADVIAAPRTTQTEHTLEGEAGSSSGRTCLIEFDIEQLRINRWELKGRSASGEEVRAWLTSLGFIPTPDGWLGDDTNLDQFTRTEITRCRSIARANTDLEDARRVELRRAMQQSSGQQDLASADVVG